MKTIFLEFWNWSHFPVLPSSDLSHLLINRNIPEYHLWRYHNNIMIYSIIMLSGVCKSIGSAPTGHHWGSRVLGLSLFRFHSLMTFFSIFTKLICLSIVTLWFSHKLFCRGLFLFHFSYAKFLWVSFFLHSACKWFLSRSLTSMTRRKKAYWAKKRYILLTFISI